MFLSRFASRVRQLEAERAKENRRDIARSLSQGQITKRDLIRWGLLSSSGAIAAKNGLSPFAPSAYASVPTGSPRTNLRGVRKFSQKLPRAYLPEKHVMKAVSFNNPITNTSEKAYDFIDPQTNQRVDALAAMRTSYHSLYNHFAGSEQANQYTNPVTRIGPIEGRPPVHTSTGEKIDYFGHQRWDEFAPKAGYILSMGQIEAGQNVHGGFQPQNANSIWSCGPRAGHTYEYSSSPTGLPKPGRFEGPGFYGCRTGYASPPLILARYGEPIITRIHNDLPVERHLNGGFGRNEISTHNHNAHNAAESDGACNAFHFPGTFYDYHWSTCLARHDAATNSGLRQKMDRGYIDSDYRAATINDKGEPVKIQGDFREIQSSLWFHDHRFFFTAENVQKGMYGLINMYSGPDCGNEAAGHAGALKLPSGSTKDWGNLDYDVNLAITNPALDRNDQLTFDIFDTDGYLGDMICVNGAYCPAMDVSARRYRFRLLNATMSRFVQIALADAQGNLYPFHMIANDGNLLPKPVLINGVLDQQGNGERYDIVIDFKLLKSGMPTPSNGSYKLYLVNLLYHLDGRGPEGRVAIGTAMKGFDIDPAVGPFLEFTIGADAPDFSANFLDAEWQARSTKFLTQQIPVQPPVRERVFRFGRADVDARDPITGKCVPDCGEAEKFPWAVSVNGQAYHSFNATRVSALVPAMGDLEHWTFINNGGGWDHPVHLHFEEGVTLNRGKDRISKQESLARKDVWRLGRGGEVKMQIRFSEFAGAYVQHCHNTMHEDFSMIMRVQLLGYTQGQPQYQVTPTPLPTEAGVKWAESEVLPEAKPDFKPTTPVLED